MASVKDWSVIVYNFQTVPISNEYGRQLETFHGRYEKSRMKVPHVNMSLGNHGFNEQLLRLGEHTVLIFFMLAI